MNALSLFANIGIAEAYLEDIGVNVVLANELVERRADLYSKIYPFTKMICGDITDESVYKSLVSEAKKLSVDILMATPPCQGISRAGKQTENDIRNLLIVPVVHMIQDIRPKYCFIENVPQFTETEITVDGKILLITNYIKQELESIYHISVNLIDTKQYGVPQTRQRTIILLSHKNQDVKWELPSPENNLVSLEDAIGELPSLDPKIKDVDEAELLNIFPDYYRKVKIASEVSVWHRPPTHIKRQVVTMMHTPTGKTAFDNDKYVPTKVNGQPVSGYKSTYRRLRWCDPASTVTMDNRKISSQNNVHPGRFLGLDENGTVLYSDARALTVFELMRIMSLPDDWPLPKDTNEAFLRSVIGEGIPPLFMKKVFQKIL